MNMKIKVVSLALSGTLALSLTPGAFAANASAFQDVKPNDWYYSAVNHVVECNYFNGVGNNSFAPNESMTRAMAVTVLARMFGGDLSSYSGKTAFTDVPVDAYYAKAVQWAVGKGIAGGTGANTFSPESYATREQIGVFLYNAVRVYGDLGSFNSKALNAFNDRSQVSSWAEVALQWATTNNIINGDGGQVKPQDSTTRAAFATISMNYDNKYKASGSETPTPAPKPGPDPTPDPTLNEEEFVISKENEINSLLVAAWGSSKAPTRDTDKLVQAARLIASGDKEVEPALKSVGFDRPFGTVKHDKYTTSRYDARSFLTTVSSVGSAMNFFKSQENVMDTEAFTEYGVGVYKIDSIQFRVSIVTYNSVPYTYTDLKQMGADWIAEQASIPVKLSDFERQVIDLTNKERVKAGLAPLSVAYDTQKAAKIRAEEAAIVYSHDRPDGSGFDTVYADIGCSLYYVDPSDGAILSCIDAYGENLAGGIYTPESVVAGWMGSAGHRKNILNPKYTHIGVALFPRIKDGVQKGYYWVQSFLSIPQ